MTVDDDALRAAFESCSLERDDWDHRAHLRVAWLYLRELGSVDAAVERMREGIYRYDEGTDRENLCNYHETMTRFWMQVMDRRLGGSPEGEEFEAFLERCPELTNKRLILEYYTQPTIVSEEARETYLPPDRRPLD